MGKREGDEKSFHSGLPRVASVQAGVNSDAATALGHSIRVEMRL